MNSLRHPVELKLTQRELDILYMLYTYNPLEITKESRDKLQDKFSFSSKTQISVYMSILLKKSVIYRSSTKSGTYHFNKYLFPMEDNLIPDEILVKLT